MSSPDETSLPPVPPAQDGPAGSEATLRARAEKLLREKSARSTATPETLSSEALRIILHELRVHQIELEMQNEELRRTQVERDISQARYFDLYNLAPVGYCTVSEQGLILEANLTAATLLGATRSALAQQPFSRFIFREDQDIYYLLWKQLIKSAASRSCELRMIKADGTPFWVQLEASALVDEGVPVLRIVLSDITGLKQAEESLRESESLLRESQNIAGLGSYVLDIPTGIWRSSDVLDQVFGLTKTSEHTVESWEAMIHPEDRRAMSDYFRNQVLGQRQAFNREYRIIRGDDRAECWVHGIGRLDFDAEGRPLKMRGTIQDITARKEAEAAKEKLEAKNRQLQKSESLACMAGAIAHLFNNQLLAVTGNIELALNDLSSHTGPVERLNVALQAARKAAEVSGLMLTYVGQEIADVEPLDLSEVSRQILSLLRPFMPPCVVLETDLPTPGPTISSSAKQIHQIINNLMTNAWEASGKNACVIRLNVKTVSAGEIPVVNRSPIDWQPHAATYACLEVADTGCGIDAQEISKIHDPFFSSKSTGRGLGLAVVLGLARAGRGAVTVESAPGRGSVFQVFFPVTTAAVSPRATAAVQVTRTSGVHTVLVVEDDPAVRGLVKLALTGFGFAVLTADDGVEAVEVFQEHLNEIECVLCDMTMPRLNGWETLAALRQLEPDLPVILTSGYSEALVMKGKHTDRPQAFLLKPYTLQEMQAAINRVLAKRKKSPPRETTAANRLPATEPSPDETGRSSATP
jgi:PAS domain S-box-containing protein